MGWKDLLGRLERMEKRSELELEEGAALAADAEKAALLPSVTDDEWTALSALVHEVGADREAGAPITDAEWAELHGKGLVTP